MDEKQKIIRVYKKDAEGLKRKKLRTKPLIFNLTFRNVKRKTG